jgi:CRP-like cAMP-binding protein
MDRLLALVRSIYPVSDALCDALTKQLKREVVKKKQWLLQPGEVSNKIYFIETGLVRGFYLQQGQEKTVWFMKENDFLISIASFYARKPSDEYIEMLEDGVVWSLTHEQLQMLYREHIEFNYVSRVLTEQYYALSEQRAYRLRTQSAQERYQQLLDEAPEIVARVPLKHLASFVGLTPETVSRIRAKRQ